MLATFTPDVLTPFSFEEAREAMEAALFDALRAKPAPPVIGLALAKTALETGRWKKIHCFNWGNVKAGEKYVGQYTSFLLNEVENGKTVWYAPEGKLVAGPGSPVVGDRWPVPPGHPQTRMRAFANRFDGAFSYVDFVSTGRYANAWRRLLLGDAFGYVHELKAAGYFTADEAIYAKAVVALQREMTDSVVKGRAKVVPVDVDERAFSVAEACASFERSLASIAEMVREERDANLSGNDTDRAPPPESEA